MDGWAGERVDWVDGCMGERAGERVDGRIGGRTGERTGGEWAGERASGQDPGAIWKTVLI